LKNIGIVGGLSPESTILYYKTIIEEYRRMFGDENYPSIIIYSVNFGKFTEFMREGKRREAADLLVKAVKSLQSAGADFALIAANTPHMFFDYIASRSSIPLLSIIDALAEVLKRDNISKVGLLGTKFTLTQEFYVRGLKKHNIEAIIPEPNDIDTVNAIIYGELVKGIFKEESRSKVVEIIKRLIRKGAKGVALACTELPLLISGTVDGTKLYDTAKIHAIKALKYAFEDD